MIPQNVLDQLKTAKIPVSDVAYVRIGSATYFLQFKQIVLTGEGAVPELTVARVDKPERKKREPKAAKPRTSR